MSEIRSRRRDTAGARWQPGPEHRPDRRKDDGTALCALFLRAQVPWPIGGRVR